MRNHGLERPWHPLQVRSRFSKGCEGAQASCWVDAASSFLGKHWFHLELYDSDTPESPTCFPFFQVAAWVLFTYFVVGYYALLFPMVHGLVHIIITAAHAILAVATFAFAIITSRIDPADNNVKVWKG